MTFKEIKEGGTVYVLNKKTINIDGMKVVAASPHVNMSMNTMTSLQPMVDVTLEADGKTTAYTIPEGLSVTYTKDMVLATAREALADEVEKMLEEAKTGLQKVEYYNAVTAKAPELLAQLNPQLREKQETEKRFAKVEGQLSSLGSKIQQLLDKLG